MQDAIGTCHNRCRRADEGSCLFDRAARILEIEAAMCGSVGFKAAPGDAYSAHAWAMFARESDALSFRDVASLKLAEAGLDYFSPSILASKTEPVWQVGVIIGDAAVAEAVAS